MATRRENVAAARENAAEAMATAKENAAEAVATAKENAAEAIAKVKPKLRGVFHEYAFPVAIVAGARPRRPRPSGKAQLAAGIYAFTLAALLGIERPLPPGRLEAAAHRASGCAASTTR